MCYERLKKAGKLMAYVCCYCGWGGLVFRETITTSGTELGGHRGYAETLKKSVWFRKLRYTYMLADKTPIHPN